MAKETAVAETFIVAEWVGTKATPVMTGMVRELSKKDVRSSLVLETTRDLKWATETNFRAEVTAESPEFLDWLEAQDEFKVTGRN